MFHNDFVPEGDPAPGAAVDQPEATVIDLRGRRGIPRPTDPDERIVARIEASRDRAAAAEGLHVVVPGDLEAVTVEDDGEVLVGEIVDPIGEPSAPAVSWLDDRSVPVLPTWMSSRAALDAAVRRLGGALWYQTQVHTVRAPWYALKLAGYASRGAGVAIKAGAVWTFAEEGRELRKDAKARKDAHTWAMLDERRRRDAKTRGKVALVVVGVGAGAAAAVVFLAPLSVQAGLGLVVTGILAKVGKPADRRILTRVSMPGRYRRLTSESVRDALVATGKVKDASHVGFPRPIMLAGPGYEAIVQLPHGVVVGDIVSKRDQVAAALHLPMTQVWIDELPKDDPDANPGLLSLWVAHRPIGKLPAPRYPLLTEGRTDYFKGVSYGYDQRHRPVAYKLEQRNGIAAGMPGAGKSAAVRTIVAGVVLDPMVRLMIFELKGIGDFAEFEPLCMPGMYGCGADEATVQAAKSALDWLEKETTRRGPLIAKYAKQGLSEDNKLTAAMVRRDPSLGPIVAVFDEFHEITRDKEAAEQLERRIKLGRALGIHIVLATQRLDAKAVPIGIVSNISNRIAMAVPSHTEVELILGTGAYARGGRPNDFTPGVDGGWGYIDDERQMRAVRNYYLTNKQIKAIATRALAMRGDIAMDAPRVELRNILHDIAAVWTDGRTRERWEDLAPALADRWPDVYGQRDARWVSDEARSMADGGLQSVDVKRGSTVRKGCDKAELDAAITRLAG